MSEIRAHIEVSAIHPKNIPASLSKTIIAELIQANLDLKGQVITDALIMKDATSGANQDTLEHRQETIFCF